MTPKVFTTFADGTVRQMTCNTEISPPGRPRDDAMSIQAYQRVYEPVEMLETHMGGAGRQYVIRWPDDVRYVKANDRLVVDP
jgi:hypothetical protein